MSVELATCTFRVTPDQPVTIPLSEGYVLYSAILDRLEAVNADASDALHSDHGHLHTPGLQGPFTRVSRPGRKKLQDDTYTLDISIVTDTDTEADAILDALAFSGGSLQVADATLRITSVEFESVTMRELLEHAVDYTTPEIHIDFISPTCILAGDHGSTEMFPHRAGVFQSLLGSWNHFADEQLQLDLSGETIREGVYELPEFKRLDSHNVVVNVVGDEQKQHIKRHGFTGPCTYRLHPDTSDAVQNSIVALALSAEYFGVGSAVSRGCGGVDVSVSER